MGYVADHMIVYYPCHSPFFVKMTPVDVTLIFTYDFVTLVFRTHTQRCASEIWTKLLEDIEDCEYFWISRVLSMGPNPNPN
jgi:hypothetical protein